jgi:hypothetical protein
MLTAVGGRPGLAPGQRGEPHPVGRLVLHPAESFGGEAWPVPYPDIIRTESVSDMTNYKQVACLLTMTEDIFNFLGWECGRLWEDSDDGKRTILQLTHAWAKYARSYSRSGNTEPLMREEVKSACMGRAAMWAALRHWAKSPGDESAQSFRESIGRLKDL